VVTASAHSEPVRHARKAKINPRRQLARYLMANATQPARLSTPDPLRSGMARRTDRQLTRGDREYERALAYMRQVWKGTRGYFPGHEMPVPRFANTPGTTTVDFGRTAKDEPVATGVRVNRRLARGLGSKEPVTRDVALTTLLHEWAHNFQQPALYAQRERGSRVADNRIEGGATAFAIAAAPSVARLSGLPYRAGQATLRYDAFRPQALNVTLKHGMPWIMRGQFRGAGA